MWSRAGGDRISLSASKLRSHRSQRDRPCQSQACGMQQPTRVSVVESRPSTFQEVNFHKSRQDRTCRKRPCNLVCVNTWGVAKTIATHASSSALRVSKLNSTCSASEQVNFPQKSTSPKTCERAPGVKTEVTFRGVLTSGG